VSDGTRSLQDEPFHWSFQFVFEYAGQLYLARKRAPPVVRITAAPTFPLSWGVARVTLPGSSHDHDAFERQGRGG